MNIDHARSNYQIGLARRADSGPDRLVQWLQDLFSQLPRTYSLPTDEWRKRHRPMLILLWLHVPFLLAFGLLQGYSLGHVGTDVSVVAIMAGLGGLKRLSRRQRAAAVSFGLVTASGALVHLSGGYIEF